MLPKIRNVYNEYPKTFWTLMGASFVDQLGSFLLFPFFALYLTRKFSVGMTQVGGLFAVFAISSLVGSIVGGALTDKYGRKFITIFGLVVSGAFSIVMGLVTSIPMFYLVGAISGTMGSIAGPARQAMVADILPEKQRAEGYGILRVSANLAATIGPALGGLLASQSYMLLFIADAISSGITAVIVYFIIPETKPETPEDEPEQSLVESVGGYSLVFKDYIFMAFIAATMLMTLVYFQMNSTLSVFLRDVHAIPAQGFGMILSLNAAMVVLFQFWVTRRISKRAPMMMMALGTAFYALGFGMYGFISGENVFILAMVAMVIITIGEMVVAPVGQALVALFAPEDMRGRYMAFSGLSWAVPIAVGPLGAGIIMDYYDPNWVWYAAGIIALFSVSGFIAIHFKSDERLKEETQSEETVVQAAIAHSAD
ncbi:MAG: MFS transporter [Chloroflexi bacterium]|nr:MFS transporter [Chloroflexota bacterium]